MEGIQKETASPAYLGFPDRLADGRTPRVVTFGAGHGTTYPGQDSGGPARHSDPTGPNRVWPDRIVRVHTHFQDFAGGIVRSNDYCQVLSLVCCIRPRSRWDQATWRRPCW